MACGDNGIAEALQAIAASMVQMAEANRENGQSMIRLINQNNFCCEQQMINNGGYIQAQVEQPSGEIVPVYGNTPPITLDPGTYPEGYTSEDEYKLDKCQMANLIFDGWLLSLRNLGAIGVFNGVALTGLVIAAIAGAIVFPPAAVILMCAAIGVMATEVTLCVVLADELEENRAELVCILYNSESVEVIIQLIADALDIIIAALGTTNIIGVTLKTIALLLLNADTLNGLMEKRAHQDYPDADCTECEPDGWSFSGFTSGETFYPAGTLIAGSFAHDTTGFELEAGSGPAGIFDPICHPSYLLQFNAPSGRALEMTWSISGWSDRACSNSWAYLDGDGVDHIGYGFPGTEIPATVCIQAIAIRSATPFTLTATIGDDCLA